MLEIFFAGSHTRHLSGDGSFISISLILECRICLHIIILRFLHMLRLTCLITHVLVQHADTFCSMIVDFCVPNLIDPQLLAQLIRRLAEYYSEQRLVAEVII
jgi:hypothetical protein